MSFFSRCSGSDGDLPHCVMDMLVTMPGSKFAAFDGVASTGCCYASGYRHGAGHGCYNQTVFAIEAEIGVLTDWRPKNNNVARREMGNCPLGALAGAKWDTSTPEDVLPLTQGYAAAAMGKNANPKPKPKPNPNPHPDPDPDPDQERELRPSARRSVSGRHAADMMRDMPAITAELLHALASQVQPYIVSGPCAQH